MKYSGVGWKIGAEHWRKIEGSGFGRDLRGNAIFQDDWNIGERRD